MIDWQFTVPWGSREQGVCASSRESSVVPTTIVPTCASVLTTYEFLFHAEQPTDSLDGWTRIELCLFLYRCKFTTILNCLVCLLHMYFPYFYIWENSYETTFQILWKPMHLLWLICKLRSTQQPQRIWGEMWEGKMQFLLSSLTLKGSKKVSQSLSLCYQVFTSFQVQSYEGFSTTCLWIQSFYCLPWK